MELREAPAREAVRVDVVRTRRDRARFLELPWRVYAGDPAWVPPLLADQRKLLDRRRHPFHEHADVELFLARRGEETVGRIAAIVNRQYVEFHEERTGFFGLFECLDDEAAAAALLRAAEQWAAARGMERLRGPMNLSTNDETFSPGVLLDGFEHPPLVMMGHNPPYYARLVEAAGYGKAKDLLAYWVEGTEPPERLQRAFRRLEARSGVRLRPLELRRLREEIDRIKSVYNSAWERNWGFVPMTEAEFEHMAAQLKPVVNPRLCLIAEIDGEPVGFLLTLPDYNQALRRLNGRLLPFGIFKLLWYRRKIDAARVLTLGVRRGFRGRGIDTLLITRAFQESVRAGYPRGECSWILEDNLDMRNSLERLGGRAYKTYRVYDRSLTG